MCGDHDHVVIQTNEPAAAAEADGRGKGMGGGCNCITRLKDWIIEILFEKVREVDWSRTWWRRAAAVLCVIFLGLLLFSFVFPFYIVYIALNGNVDWIYQYLQKEPAADERKHKAKRWMSENPGRLAIAARLGILVLVWLSVNLSVGTLRDDAKLLGTPLWKWSVLAVVVLLLTPAILVFADSLAYTGLKIQDDSRLLFWFWGSNARRVLYFAAILLVWCLYFAADYDQIQKAYRPVHKYIILTLVALLIGATFGLLNDIAVLLWKSKFMYTPAKKKQIVFSAYHLLELQLQLSKDDNKPEKGKTIDDAFSLQDIDEVAGWLTKWIDVPPNYSKMEHKPDDLQSSFPLDKQRLSKGMLLLDDDDINFVASNDEIYKNNMRCYNGSLVFANKLYEEFQLTRILSTILIVVQVVTAFLVWLFITGLATTRLVVTLGSLFLGLTFVFGDTCKTFFQGCIFSFVTHPLDVGDIVSIDSDQPQFKVKRINVAATIFIQINPGKEDETKCTTLIYPNSELATKKIFKQPNQTLTIPIKACQLCF